MNKPQREKVGRKSLYDFKEITKLRSYGFSMSEIAERLNYKFRNMERAYYRWVKRNEGKKETDTMTDSTDSITDTIIPKKFELEIVEEFSKPEPIKTEPSTKNKKGLTTDDLRTSYRVLTGKTTRKGFYHIVSDMKEFLSEIE